MGWTPSNVPTACSSKKNKQILIGWIPLIRTLLTGLKGGQNRGSPLYSTNPPLKMRPPLLIRTPWQVPKVARIERVHCIKSTPEMRPLWPAPRVAGLEGVYYSWTEVAARLTEIEESPQIAPSNQDTVGTEAKRVQSMPSYFFSHLITFSLFGGNQNIYSFPKTLGQSFLSKHWMFILECVCVCVCVCVYNPVQYGF